MDDISIIILFAQTIKQSPDTNWEIILSALAIVGAIVGVAWRAGWLHGERQRTDITRNEDIAQIRVDIHDIRNKMQQLWDKATVLNIDVEHLKQFRQELRETLKVIERDMRRLIVSRGGSPFPSQQANQASEDSNYGN